MKRCAPYQVTATKSDVQRGYVPLPRTQASRGVRKRIREVALETVPSHATAAAALAAKLASETFPRLIQIKGLLGSAEPGDVVLSSAYWHENVGVQYVRAGGILRWPERAGHSPPWRHGRLDIAEAIAHSQDHRLVRTSHVGPKWRNCLWGWTNGIAALQVHGADERALGAFRCRLGQDLTERLVLEYLSRQACLNRAVGLMPPRRPRAKTICQERYMAQAHRVYRRTLRLPELTRSREMRREVNKAIYAGVPLEPVLTHLLRVPGWVIRHVEENRRRLYTAPESLNEMRFLSLLTPETAPANEEERRNMLFLMFHFEWLGLSRIEDALLERERPVFGQMVKGKVSVDGLVDYLSFVEDLAQEQMPDALAILGHPTLAELVQAAHRWRRLRSHWLNRQPAGESADLSWPPLIASQVALKGWTFTPLNTVRALASEGVEMGSCVSSFSSKCIRREAFIVSAQKGRQRMTLELAPPGTSRTALRLVQVKGRKNSRVPTAAVNVAREFVARINDGSIHKSREVTSSVLWRRATGDLDLRMLCEWEGDPHGTRRFLDAVAQGGQAFDRLRPAIEIAPGRGQLVELVLGNARSHWTRQDDSKGTGLMNDRG